MDLIDCTEALTGCAIEWAYVDKGYRGHDARGPGLYISSQKRCLRAKRGYRQDPFVYSRPLTDGPRQHAELSSSDQIKICEKCYAIYGIPRQRTSWGVRSSRTGGLLVENSL